MSKSITIPMDLGDPVVVVLNGVKYVYKAGETVTVPDEVAALFESNSREAVIYGRRASSPLIATGLYAGDDCIPVYTAPDGSLRILKSDILALIPAPELPAVTGDDEGKVLTVNNEGVWAAAEIPSQLPAVTDSDAGKVLTVSNAGEWGAADLPS